MKNLQNTGAQPKFSVVTCCYNQGRFLTDTIESVLAQSYPNFEHIIIDAESTDNTREVCSRYPHVQYHYMKDEGQSAALNAALRLADGDIIAWLNSDDYYAAGAFECAAREITPTYDRAMVLGHAHAVGPQGEFLWTMESRPVEFYRLLFHPNLYRLKGITCMPCQPSVFFHRRVLEDIGFLEVNLRYSMDYDYWLRAMEKGYSFRLINQVFSNYRFHATSLSTQGFDRFLPEWTQVSRRHLQTLSPSRRIQALWWMLGARMESARHRKKNRLQDALLGSNPNAMVCEPSSTHNPIAPSSMPKVSVVTPARNAEPFIRQAIESVLAQTYSNLEMLVVDDGSTDATASIVRSYAERHSGRIRLLQHPDHKNHGVAASRNLAIQEAQGQLIAFLDADDQWAPLKTERHVQYMLHHPDVVLSFTRATILRNARTDAFMTGIKELGGKPPLEIAPALMQVLHGTLQYAFSSVMAWREVIDKAGRFTEQLPFQSEDRILVAQIASQGLLGYLNEDLCFYRTHDQSYSHAAALSGLAPVLFFDLQCRVMSWLLQQPSTRHLARQVAQVLIPVTFVDALSWSLANRRHGKILWHDFMEVARNFPGIAARILARFIPILCQRLSGQESDRYRLDHEVCLGVARLADHLSQQGIKSILLYGAGKHTRRLLSLTSFKPIQIKAILDDACQGEPVGGVPIWAPLQALEQDAEAVVVVSSDSSQSRLYEQAKKHGFRHVFRLYGRW